MAALQMWYSLTHQQQQIDAGGEKIYFRIGEVAQLVGVDAHVLRYWESEFRMKPRRSPSGWRRKIAPEAPV
jgi:transposase-like protein